MRITSILGPGNIVAVYRPRLHALPRIAERKRATDAEAVAARVYANAYRNRHARGIITLRKAIAALATYRAAIARTDAAQAAIARLLPIYRYTL